MSQFDSQTLAHLKRLCRIDCSPEQEENLLSSLSKILRVMEELNEVDTDGVKPCSFVLQSMTKPALREDVAGEILSRDQFLANCPSQVGGMIRVPPVLK